MRTANAKSAHSSQYIVRSFGVSLGTQNPPPALAVARELGLGLSHSSAALAGRRSSLVVLVTRAARRT